MKTILAIAALTSCALAQTATKVEVTANDQMRFSLKKIEATVGKTIEITVKNIGKLPKASMAHNFVILKPGTPHLILAAKCHQAKDKNYIAADPDSRAAIVTHTPLLGPGESATIKFTPTAAGDYPFLCTFPGHCSEMNGTITVK